MQLLVDSLLWCSLDAGIVVTGASVPEVCIFILLSLGGALTNGRWSYRGERWFGYRLHHCGRLPQLQEETELFLHLLNPGSKLERM
jgi:hypothetical protein